MLYENLNSIHYAKQTVLNSKFKTLKNKYLLSEKRINSK